MFVSVGEGEGGRAIISTAVCITNLQESKGSDLQKHPSHSVLFRSQSCLHLVMPDFHIMVKC